MSRRINLKGIELNRTIGVEVEGYTEDFRNMINNRVRHSQLKRDGSLTGSRYGRSGIEVVTVPIKKLDLLDEVFEDITKYKWSCGRGTAGTHIHVDARDYYLEDKIKMAIFMSKIEKAMFLIVKKSRYSRRRWSRNQYCRPIEDGWEQVLDKLNNQYSKVIDWKHYRKIGQLQYELSERRMVLLGTPSQTRYQFVNVWNSSHDTIEFRIFHAIRSAKDAKKFALLAYNIVEMVKNSSLEQLNFIADAIMNRTISAEHMVKCLCEAVGLDFTLKIENKDLARNIDSDKRNQRRIIAI